MGLLKNIVRPLVPKSLRKKRSEARAIRETQIWRNLDLHKDLDGVRIRVSSKADWTVFNEIFVEGIYDRSITNALNGASAAQPLRVLDLGANVGFFTLRFAQLVFQSGSPDRPFLINCVEGSPRVHGELCARVAENPRLKGHTNIHHGLVGKRSGVAQIYESPFGAGNSTIPQHWSKPTTVSYVDLCELMSSGEQIDLLKCDIEGSEQIFQESYRDLLNRTKSAIVELHHKHIDPKLFDDGMQALGFSSREVIWESERANASLVLYSR